MAGVLHEGGGLAELSIFENRKCRDAAAGVVRHQNIFTRFVDRDVTGIGAARRHFVQECKLARCMINGEGAHAAAVRAFVVAYFIHGVEKAAVGMQHHERWIGCLRCQTQGSGLARFRVEAVGVDAFALAAVLGVGADVENIFAVRFGRSGGEQRRE